jgi:hypothetical protein
LHISREIDFRAADSTRHGHAIKARVSECMEERFRQLAVLVGLIGVAPNEGHELAGGFD